MQSSQIYHQSDNTCPTQLTPMQLIGCDGKSLSNLVSKTLTKTPMKNLHVNVKQDNENKSGVKAALSTPGLFCNWNVLIVSATTRQQGRNLSVILFGWSKVSNYNVSPKQLSVCVSQIRNL